MLIQEMTIDRQTFAWIRHIATGHRLMIRGGHGLNFCGPDMVFLLNGDPLPSYRRLDAVRELATLEWAYAGHPGHSILTVERLPGAGQRYAVAFNGRRWDVSRLAPDGAGSNLNRKAG